MELGEDEEAEEEINQEILRRGERTHKIDLQGVKESDDELEEGHIETETTTGGTMITSAAASKTSETVGAQEKDVTEPADREDTENAEDEEEAAQDDEEEGDEEEMADEMEAAMDNPLIREEEARLDGM